MNILAVALSIQASSTLLPLWLLPGTYTSTDNPKLLHDTLTSTFTINTSIISSDSPGPGTGLTTFPAPVRSMPFSIALELGIGAVLFGEERYSGNRTFVSMSSSSNLSASDSESDSFSITK